MREVQVLGALLIVAGVAYALVYVGWLRRSRGGSPAEGMSTAAATTELTARTADRSSTVSGLARPLTLAWVEGTYLSTTTAISRHERVAVEGLGERARATMVVDDSAVRWEREGTVDLRVAGPRLLGASLERRVAHKRPGQAHLVVVSWTAENERHGEHYVTGFLPRSRADSAVLVSAVQRLMKICVPIDAPTTPDGTP